MDTPMHYLVTTSSNTGNLLAVQFLSSFFSNCSKISVTLLHICRQDSSDTCQGLTEMWEKHDDTVTGKLTVGAKKSLDKAKELFNRSSIPIEQMITKTVAERYGKVKDILTEGNRGHYDAIVLGRRATYALQWMFAKASDELPQAMITDKSLQTPIWICCEHDPGRKNVLICVDGSENSFRAVDHTGYVLSHTEDHSATLFHVNSGTGVDESALFKKAETILLDNGVKSERISSRSGRGLSVANAIISEGNRGGYSAVALGLAGEGKKLLEEYGLMGGTTSTLIHKAEKFALWCCP